MLAFRLLRLTLGAFALALLLQPELTRAQGNDPKRYTIDTIDGVKLKANLWVGAKGKDGATVILLHDFDKTGGSCQKDGWNALAAALQKEGHSVISFDFRGHGESIGVDKRKFWDRSDLNPNLTLNEFPYNPRYVKARIKGGEFPETIAHTDFNSLYYPFLVNDIAAVRAFIDRQNDAGTINTKNIVVIGAGQGATLGALWMATEQKRKQAGMMPILGLQVALAQPGGLQFKGAAGQDIAAGIFLSPSPTLGGQSVPLMSWLREVGKEEKIPLAFISADNDKAGSQFASRLLLAVSPNFVTGKAPPKELPFTGEKNIATKLTGSKMLDADLPTESWIVKDYLPPLLEKRTIIAQAAHQFDKFPSFWIFNNRFVPARIKDTDDAPRPIPLIQFNINR